MVKDINYSCILFRPGSFTRIDSQPYNKNRKIYYMQYDTTTGDMKKIEVPVKTDEEVFIEGVFAKKVNYNREFLQISDVLNKLKKQSSGNISLNKKLIDLKTPNKFIQGIREKHKLAGIIYT